VSRGDLLDLLRSTGSVRFGEFTLTSGKTSPYYIDMKRAVTRPEVLRAIARGIAKYAHRADRIAGVELGAVPIAAAAALETGKPYVMVRKERKEHGTSKDFEGDLKPGDRLLFVEDVVTTGGTLVRAVERMRVAGAVVSEAVTVVDREEGGKEALASIHVILRALITAEELLQVAKSGPLS
jgi:orotate phosphoribosyltransferase